MNNIDERIVEMQFNNSQFEKGVKESLKTLDDLKKSLKFDDAADGLKKLQDAGNSFSLQKVADGVDQLTDRFSYFGTFVGRIVENLADTIYNKLGRALESVTVGQISAGWDRYADDTQAVQTIMFATGKSIEEVEEELERLTWFTDETSYNYADMVGNIGKFTSAGVDLKDARVSMQGIAVWAASAGQNAQTASRAMYNISQAMGMGKMTVADWKSIELANMATIDFKNNAIAAAIALGKLDKEGNLVLANGQKIKVTAENMRETLAYGWFDKDVMLEVFGEYGEFSEKVKDLQDEYWENYRIELSTSEAMEMLAGSTNMFSENAFKAAQEAKTLGEAVDALRDATATKWMNIFKLIFGNYEQAKVLWTKFANDLYDIFVAPLGDIVNVLKEWHRVGDDGRSAWDDFMEGIFDIMDGLKGILITIRDALGSLFPDITIENLRALSSGVKEFGANFKAMFAIPEEASEAISTIEKFALGIKDLVGASGEGMSVLEEEATELDRILEKGARGDDVREMQRMLVALGYDLPKYGVDGIFGPETQKALNDFKEASGLAIDGVFDAATARSLSDAFDLRHVGQEFEELEGDLKYGDRSEEVRKLQERLIELGYDLDRFGADGIWGPETQRAYEQWQKDNGMEPTGIYDRNAHAIMKSLLGYDRVSEDIAEKVDGAFSTIIGDTDKAEKAAVKYGNRLDNLRSIFGGITAVVGIFSKVIVGVGKILGYIVTLFGPVIDAFIAVGAAIGECFISLNNWLDESGAIDKWVESVKTALGPFGNWLKKVADAILNFFGLNKDMNGEMMTFGRLWGNIKESLKKNKVINALADAFERLKNTFAAVGPKIKEQWEAIKAAFGSKFQSLAGKAPGLLDKITNAIVWFIDKAATKISQWVEKLPGALEKIRTFFEGLINPVKENGKNFLHSLGDRIKGLTKGLPDNVQKFILKTISDVVYFFKHLRENIVNLWDIVKNFFKGKSIGEIWDSIKKFAVDLWTKVKTSVGSAINSMGETAEWLLVWGPVIILTIFALYKTYKLIKSLVNIVENFSDYLNTGKKETKTLSEKVLMFAGAIALIAAAIAGITLLRKTYGDAIVWESVGFLALFVLGFIGITALAKKFINTGTSEALGKLGESFYNMAKAIAIITAVIYVISKFKEDTFKTGLTRVADIMMMILIFEGLMALISRIGDPKLDGILKLAGAIAILTMVIGLLAIMPDSIKNRGYESLTTIMIILVAFLGLMGIVGRIGRLKVDGIIKLSGALAILTILVAMLGVMPEKIQEKGLTFLIVIMGMLVIFIFALREVSVFGANIEIKGLLAVMGALLVLTGITALLGTLRTKTLLKGLLSLVVIGGVFALAILSARKLGETDPKKLWMLLPILIAVGAIGAGFVLLTKQLDDVEWSSILKAVVAMAVIIAGFAILVKASKGGEDLNWRLVWLIPVAVAVGLLGIVFVKMAKQMEKLSSKAVVRSILALAAIVGAIVLLARGMNKVDIGWKAMIALLPIVAAIGALGAGFVIMTKYMADVSTETLIKTIIGMVSVIGVAIGFIAVVSALNINPLTGIGALFALLGIVGVMVGFSWALNQVKDIDSAAISSFANSITMILGVATLMAGIGGAVGPLNAIGGIIAIAVGIAVVIAIFGALTKIPEVYDVLTSGAEGLGELIGKFLGAVEAAKLERFNEATAAIGTVDEVDQTKVENAIGAAQSIANFLQEVGAMDIEAKSQGISGWYGEETKADTLIDTMKKFAEVFNEYATTMNSIDANPATVFAQTTFAIMIAKQIARFLEEVAAMDIETKSQGISGWYGEETKTDTLLDSMKNFATVFHDYAETMASIDGNPMVIQFQTTFAIMIAKQIARFLEEVAAMDIEAKSQGLSGWFGKETKADTLIDTMKKFAEVFNEYATTMGGIKANPMVIQFQTTFAIMIAKQIARFLEEVAAMNINPNKRGISRLFGDSTKVETLTKTMENFPEAFNKYAEEMSKIKANPFVLQMQTTFAISIARQIAKFMEEIAAMNINPNKRGISRLFGDSTKVETLTKTMTTFPTAFNAYADEMGKIKANPFVLQMQTTFAISIARQIAKFMEEVAQMHIEANHGLIGGLFKDENSVNTLIDTMKAFSSAFKEYVTNIGGLGINQYTLNANTESAISIATQIGHFLEEVGDMKIENKAKGIKGWFSDQTNGETVIDSVGSLAKAIGDNKSKFEGIAGSGLVDDIENSIEVMYALARFLNYLGSNNLSGITFATSLEGGTGYASRLANALSALGDISNKIVEFSNITNGIDLSSIANVIQAVTEFLKLLTVRTDLSVNDIFGEFDGEVITARFSEFVSAINSAVTSDSSIGQLMNIGQSMSDNVVSGFNSADLSAIYSYPNGLILALTPYSESFHGVGENFAMGLSNGVYAKSYLAVNAAVYTAQLMIQKIKEAFDSHSPSRVARGIGEFFTEGLALGVGDKSDDAANAVGDVANNMLSVANGTLSNLSDLLAANIDVTPTISPVVDLSNARMAAGSLSSMFGQQQAGLNMTRTLVNKVETDADGVQIRGAASLSAENMAMLKEQVASLANGLDNLNSDDVVNGIQGLSDKFGSLAEAVTNMKLVLDTGALVGNTSAAYDRQFGVMSSRRERGN